MLVWQAVVRWADDGTPVLKKYPRLEIQSDNQTFLFQELSPEPSESDRLGTPDGPDAAELPPGTYIEGAVKQILVNAYERDQNARRACLANYGPSCAVCGFGFAEKYGVIGKGFIHIHHLKPLSEIGESYRLDPVRDLRPVCPNCHAMLHRQSPPFSIDELKVMLRN